MGETLAETRLEVEAQRDEVGAMVERLRARMRRAIDLRAKVRENPALYGGLAAGAVFLAIGGPGRVIRAARRRVAPTRGEQAYDALPSTMRTWVDAASEALGPRAAEARRTLSEELIAWRNAPRGKRKARELAREVAEGPPSASRTFWRALEAAAMIASTAVARRAVERLLSGDRPLEAAAELSPAHGNGSAAVTRSPDFAGWSARGSSGR